MWFRNKIGVIYKCVLSGLLWCFQPDVRGVHFSQEIWSQSSNFLLLFEFFLSGHNLDSGWEWGSRGEMENNREGNLRLKNQQSQNKVSCKDLVGSLGVQSCLADRQGLCNKTDDHRCNREVSSFTLLNTALKSGIPALVSTSEFLRNRRQVASIFYRSLSVWHIFSSATEQGRM